MDTFGQGSNNHLVNPAYRQAPTWVLQRQRGKHLSLSLGTGVGFEKHSVSKVSPCICLFIKAQTDLLQSPTHPPTTHMPIHPSLHLSASLTLGRSLPFLKPVSSSVGIIVSLP